MICTQLIFRDDIAIGGGRLSFQGLFVDSRPTVDLLHRMRWRLSDLT